MSEQGKLPGMESRDLPEIEQAAERYRKIRDQRCALSKQESEAKSALIQTMMNAGRSYYSYNGLVVQLSKVENVKVKARDEDDEEPIGNFRQPSRQHPVINTSPASEFIEEIEEEMEGNIAAATECACGHLARDHEENGACQVVGEGGGACDCDGFAQLNSIDDQERERLHREAVATWRRERPASVESEAKGEDQGEADPQINENGVYVKGVEVIKVPFPKKAGKTEVVISLVKDRVDGMWRSAYSATAGVASFTGPICDYDPCHETREGAIAAAGWKARSFLLRQVSTGGLSEAAKRKVEAAIPALDDWLEINARDHSAIYPDDEIEAEPEPIGDPKLYSSTEEQRAAAAETEEDRAKHWAEWRASLSDEERNKYYNAPCSCGHIRDYHAGDDAEGACSLCKNCQSYHCPDCDTKRGHQATCEYYVLGEGTPVQKPEQDDFTAERCDECGRIDGAHTQECSKSNALTFDDYLAYARAHFKKNHQSHARKMEITRLNDDKVREWKQQQQAVIRKCNHPSGCENEAREGFGYCEPHRAASVERAIEEGKKATAKAKKQKGAKLSPVEAAIDR